jgi:hypothetical protein
VAAWLGRSLGASEALFESFSTETMGVALPEAVLTAPAVEGALAHAASAARRVASSAADLEAAAEGEEARMVVAFAQLGAALAAYFHALVRVDEAVGASITPASLPDPDDRELARRFAGELAKHVADVVICGAVVRSFPGVAFALKILGLAEWEWRAGGDSELSRDHVVAALRLERLGALFSDPAAHFRDAHGWGDESFDPSEFFHIYAQLQPEHADVEVGADDGGAPFVRHGYTTLSRADDRRPPGLRLSLSGAAALERDVRVPLNEEWGLGVLARLSIEARAAVLVDPPLDITLVPLERAKAEGGLRLFVNRNPEAQGFDLLAGTGLLALEATDVVAGAGLELEWDPTANEAAVTVVPFAELKGATLRVGTSGADGFIGALLASARIAGSFDLAVEWHERDGLRVRGSGGFEVALPLHQSLGFVELLSLFLALRISDDGALSLEASSALTGHLGPLTASVDRLGALVDLRFVEGADARLGPFDVALRFKPPTGVGLAVDATVVRGGGFLRFEPDLGEYDGGLELEIAELLSVTAIGLITTRMPEGRAGFSLLAILALEFGSPIQLGLGFTWNGVGGILGLNRTMRLEPMAEGIKSGAAERILFPRNIVANAPRIISDLRSFFPPRDDTFLVGGMLKLGWGTPSLLRLSLGVIVQIPPGNIAILGVLKVALPDEEAAVLKLNVGFLGALEVDKERAWFYATLFDSHVLLMTLEGGMGVLVAWGEDSNFVISVGGFHPRYAPPPLPFPTPDRLAISILNQPAARIRVMAYFAVTSNTVQFGARAELFFGFDAVSVEGHLALDALFQFSPFYFIVEISASVALTVFGAGLFVVRLRGSLEGPTPWRLSGGATVGILFFEITVDVDETWGETLDTTLPGEPVMPLLAAELAKDGNWLAQPPRNSHLLVSLRQADAAAGSLLLHPLGELVVSQRAVPLGVGIDKVGSKAATDGNRFSLHVVGGALTKLGDHDELFAMAQFQSLPDGEKLSRPAFERVHGGLRLGAAGTQLGSSRVVKRRVRYRRIVVDAAGRPAAARLFALWTSLFAHFAGGAAVAEAEGSQKRGKQLQPFDDRIRVVTPGFSVARIADNAPVAPEAARFASEAQAREYLRLQLAADPTQARKLHVIPRYEASGAA